MRLTQPTIKGSHLMHDSVYKNDLDGVRYKMKKNPEAINSKDENGRTPLIVAACFNRCDVIDLLMTSSKCDVNEQDIDDSTALHESSDRGYTDAVKIIIESGRYDVNMRNSQGETALMRAVMYDYIDIVRMILKSGNAALNITDIHGQTALHIALREGSHVTAMTLIAAGCDVSAVDKTGKSVLYTAIHSPLMTSLEPAKHIVEAGCDLTIDKMWIMNEEKHNIFYQDDEFYVNLRQMLRKNSSSSESCFRPPLNRQSRVMSPRDGVRRNICTSNFATLQRTNSSPPVSLSPMVKQKILTSEAFTNGISMDWTTPPGSPVRSRRNSSRSSLAGSRSSSLASKSSSFDSDIGESPCCLSPRVFTYPSSHVEFHTLTRGDSETLDQTTSRCRPDCIAESTAHVSSIKAGHAYIPNENSRSTSVITVNNYCRQRSEILSRDKPEKTCQRQISLPTKPTVTFSKNIQIIHIGNRR